MSLKSKIFSMAIMAAATLSIMSCNDEQVSPAGEAPADLVQGFDTYEYKGVRYQEPIDGDNKFVNTVLTKAWSENPEAAMYIENDVHYIYDSNEALEKAHLADKKKNNVNAMIDGTTRPFAQIDVYQDKDFQVTISSYGGPSLGEEFEFMRIGGINDAASSIRVSNFTPGVNLVARFFEHAKRRGKNVTAVVSAFDTKEYRDLKKYGMNDKISSWHFYYQP